MRFRFSCITSLLFACAVSLPAQRGDRPGEVQRELPPDLIIPPAPALSPEEALKTIKVAPGFRVELVAADPLVHDPVAMAHGPDGRIWVVEMRGFMPNVEGVGEDKPVGSIAVLEDTNADGRMDKRTVFLEGLVMPRALALVDGGVLVGEPPKLWYCRDTDGDGRSDTKVEVASDYGSQVNPEHTANALLRAMDNWMYNAKHTVKFRYVGDGKFERQDTAMRGQWGISQDDWGRLYFNSNSDPLRADLVEASYLRRNIYLYQPAGPNTQIAPAKLPVWPGRITPGINRGYRMLRPNITLPTVTAACAPLVYRGGLFPAEFAGNVFIAEPAANLVKRVKISDREGVLSAENAYEQAEFLTSTDERFRPVNLYNGPDGALYIVDLYRGILQHRTYVTSYLRRQIEQRKLDQPIGLGRIYRVVPEAAPAVLPPVKLAGAGATDLVRALGHGNGWVRDMAQQLLVEKRDASAIDPLKASAARHPRPVTRLQALWTLEGMGALERTTIVRALGDIDPRVRAAAVRLSEKWLAEDPEIFERIATMAKHAAEVGSPVRLQLGFSLGQLKTPAAEEALRELVIQAATQPLLADAVVSGLAGREESFVEALVKLPVDKSETARSTITLATSAVLRSAKPERIDRILKLAADSSVSDVGREAVLAGVRRFIPKSGDGRLLLANVPQEPKPLAMLAAKPETALGRTAVELLDRLRWPGKPGVVSGNTPPLTPEQQVLFEKGKNNFAMTCAACHQANGQGLAGLAPPLVNSRWVTGHEQILARIILRGKETENVVMPPLKALDDETIASIMTFIRRSWTHEASPVSPRDVARAREAVAGRDEPVDDGDLEELLEQFPVRERRNRDWNREGRERDGNSRPRREGPSSE